MLIGPAQVYTFTFPSLLPVHPFLTSLLFPSRGPSPPPSILPLSIRLLHLLSVCLTSSLPFLTPFLLLSYLSSVPFFLSSLPRPRSLSPPQDHCSPCTVPSLRASLLSLRLQSTAFKQHPCKVKSQISCGGEHSERRMGDERCVERERKCALRATYNKNRTLYALPPDRCGRLTRRLSLCH